MQPSSDQALYCRRNSSTEKTSAYISCAPAAVQSCTSADPKVRTSIEQRSRNQRPACLQPDQQQQPDHSFDRRQHRSKGAHHRLRQRRMRKLLGEMCRESLRPCEQATDAMHQQVRSRYRSQQSVSDLLIALRRVELHSASWMIRCSIHAAVTTVILGRWFRTPTSSSCTSRM